MTIEASLLIVGLAAVAAAWDVARRKYNESKFADVAREWREAFEAHKQHVRDSAKETTDLVYQLTRALEASSERLHKLEERVSEVRSIATANKPLPSRITGASR